MSPCVACGATGLRAGPVVPAEAIAAAWASRSYAFAAVAPAEVLRRVRADLGGDAVRFLACPSCGLEEAEPRRGWTGAHYPAEAYGVHWDHLRALEWLADDPPARLLELGSADGAFLEAAAARGIAGVGIDFSPEAVRRARERGLDVRRADAGSVRAVAGEGAPYAAVALFQVIEHLEAPDEVFETIGALAAPGARLLVGCPSETRYTRRVTSAETVGGTDFWDWPPQHTFRWTPRALTAFLARHGWAVERVEREPYHAVGAAAHLTAIDGEAGGWYARPVRRRWETLRRRLRLRRAVDAQTSGLRMLALARRAA